MGANPLAVLVGGGFLMLGLAFLLVKRNDFLAIFGVTEWGTLMSLWFVAIVLSLFGVGIALFGRAFST